ncbi:MAG: class I SAM-dependent methyltransferase [Salibacteraceae bacterium]
MNQTRKEIIGKGFDRVAVFYDFVLKLTFGTRVEQLERSVLKTLNTTDHALIVGGGSGRTLHIAMELNIANRYTYAEYAPKMVDLTRKRFTKSELSRITFTLDYQDEQFDVIIFPFVLDCFPSDEIIELIQTHKKCLKKGGSIVLIDFNQEEGYDYQPSVLKASFIKLLYSFFKSACGIPASKLAPFNSILTNEQLICVNRLSILNGWVQASVWNDEPIT